MNLAPIVIFVYNRFNHTVKTIESLRENYLAKDSEIFIFSDASKSNDDDIKVSEVRKYIKGIKGFKKVTIVEREENNGLAKSVITGVTDIINKYGKVIVLEDDLITSEYFLEYMNKSLDMYQNRTDIWSISGYTPDIKIPQEYIDEIYLTYRGCSWGWATWKDRWEKVDWDIIDYYTFKKDKIKVKQFNKSGTDLAPMLNDQMEKRINSWAIRWVYNQYKQGKCTVYPVRSLVKNIGMDMSGTHSIVTKKYEANLAKSIITLNKDININNDILKEFKNIYDLNLIGYISIGIKKLGLYKPARKIRNSMIKFLTIKSRR